MQTVKRAPDPAAVRVQIGPGAPKTVADEVARLGAACALILSMPGRSGTAEEIAAVSGTTAAGMFS